ncbi:MAG TPA: magnesium-translocating P-type ATPase, partial [Methylomirabilota bacterium]|nr:magnesium-translocating P-type ATPase [Methylomirabilota bacterium]
MPLQVLLQNAVTHSADEVIEKLQTTKSGLSQIQTRERLKTYGPNTIHNEKVNVFSLFLRQFTSNPLLLILAAATIISFFLGQKVSSYYIFGIIVVSILLGFWNEYTAEKTIDNLLKKITRTALVLRNGEKEEVPLEDVTIGDIVLLSQGTILPADLRLFEANQLEINESALTGEAKTIYKITKTLSLTTPHLIDMKNIGFMGTSVTSGSGKGIVIQVGKNTEFGQIAKSATFIKPATEFQNGLAKFGKLIINIIILLTLGIFAINALLGHPVLDSLIFALAIAVGLTPELLPVIVTVSLSHGAGKLAKKHVVVKKLLSLENLGNMDILCTDKTGTLTEGNIHVENYSNLQEKKDESVLRFALLCNSAVVNHKVLGDTIDVAIWQHALANNIKLDTSIKKLHEEPFDYERKAMFTVVKEKTKAMLIVKGSPEALLSLSRNVMHEKRLKEKLRKLRLDGLRVIAVATKPIQEKGNYSWSDVTNLSLLGYITFLDIPKKTARHALAQLQTLNVVTKVITGDNEIITKKICQQVGMDVAKILTGPAIENLSDEELKKKVLTINIFAQVTPLQKLKIIQALQANGHTVGYLGDGINDLPALHNADVGISVNSAVDVAKDAASVVLLRKSLDVIDDGVREGRKTFSNTIKYILMSTSSNFGNMFSAAFSSFFLPFLPMTSLQILLTNTLYDVAQIALPSDNVDHASLVKPRHWDIRFIKDYMLFFGPLSSVYDFLTFGILLFVFHARGAVFQTGWFVESLATEILVVFVI